MNPYTPAIAKDLRNARKNIRKMDAKAKVDLMVSAGIISQERSRQAVENLSRFYERQR